MERAVARILNLISQRNKIERARGRSYYFGHKIQNTVRFRPLRVTTRVDHKGTPIVDA